MDLSAICHDIPRTSPSAVEAKKRSSVSFNLVDGAEKRHASSAMEETALHGLQKKGKKTDTAHRETARPQPCSPILTGLHPLASGEYGGAGGYSLKVVSEEAVTAVSGVSSPGLDRTDDGYLVWISAEGGKRTFIYAKLQLHKLLPDGSRSQPCPPPPDAYLEVKLTYAGVRVSKQNKKDVYTATPRVEGEEFPDVTRRSTAKGTPLFQLFRGVGKGGLGVGAVAPAEDPTFTPEFSEDGLVELRYRINDISKNHQKNLFRVVVTLLVPSRDGDAGLLLSSATSRGSNFAQRRLNGRWYTPLCNAQLSAVNVTSKDLEKLKLNKRKRALSNAGHLLASQAQVALSQGKSGSEELGCSVPPLLASGSFHGFSSSAGSPNPASPSSSGGDSASHNFIMSEDSGLQAPSMQRVPSLSSPLEAAPASFPIPGNRGPLPHPGKLPVFFPPSGPLLGRISERPVHHHMGSASPPASGLYQPSYQLAGPSEVVMIQGMRTTRSDPVPLKRTRSDPVSVGGMQNVGIHGPAALIARSRTDIGPANSFGGAGLEAGSYQRPLLQTQGPATERNGSPAADLSPLPSPTESATSPSSSMLSQRSSTTSSMVSNVPLDRLLCHVLDQIVSVGAELQKLRVSHSSQNLSKAPENAKEEVPFPSLAPSPSFIQRRAFTPTGPVAPSPPPVYNTQFMPHAISMSEWSKPGMASAEHSQETSKDAAQHMLPAKSGIRVGLSEKRAKDASRQSSTGVAKAGKNLFMNLSGRDSELLSGGPKGTSKKPRSQKSAQVKQEGSKSGKKTASNTIQLAKQGKMGSKAEGQSSSSSKADRASKTSGSETNMSASEGAPVEQRLVDRDHLLAANMLLGLSVAS